MSVSVEMAFQLFLPFCAKAQVHSVYLTASWATLNENWLDTMRLVIEET